MAATQSSPSLFAKSCVSVRFVTGRFLGSYGMGSNEDAWSPCIPAGSGDSEVASWNGDNMGSGVYCWWCWWCWCWRWWCWRWCMKSDSFNGRGSKSTHILRVFERYCVFANAGYVVCWKSAHSPSVARSEWVHGWKEESSWKGEFSSWGTILSISERTDSEWPSERCARSNSFHSPISRSHRARSLAESSWKYAFSSSVMAFQRAAMVRASLVKSILPCEFRGFLSESRLGSDRNSSSRWCWKNKL